MIPDFIILLMYFPLEGPVSQFWFNTIIAFSPSDAFHINPHPADLLSDTVDINARLYSLYTML